MTLSQSLLRSRAAERVRAAHPALAAKFDLEDADGLLAAQSEIASLAESSDTQAVVVLRRFSLAAWVRATCGFAAGVSPDRAVRWRQAFTRTVFLAGNPDQLRERFAFDHISEDGSAAWRGPEPASASAALRRLLKRFDSERALPIGPAVRIPLAGPDHGSHARHPVRRDLYVATSGMALSAYLVHVNHLLVEAVMDGLIAPGDELTVRELPSLVGASVPFASLRIGVDACRPDRLRAYAALTEEITRV
ncbi:hypothetical protein A6A06_38970 [Streptomyces sp. CB02923]|uniref:DUF6182 family protein n=1 Tax=Streptomyces sp. CB02923 TaxID=1718985 RepID=UPI00093D8152|nr:DUF6182 family protein [Streptomyces sp. CB02923]OKI03521.1 hypothetical protein A6A06_38970 [Streptomyces sp. CB02923]